MAAGAETMSIAGNKFDGFKCNANDVINFKLVRQEEDVFDSETIFKADMTHQLFGESESIFGYKDLAVNIYCTASRMITYINIKYSEKISPEDYDGVSADNLMKSLSQVLQPGFLTSQDQFISCIAKDTTFKPFGDLVHSYSVTKDGEEKKYEVYKTGIETAGFRDYHGRLQPFLLFYVDAASYIDVDDERWAYYLLFEKYKSSEGEPMYAFAGYMTVYNYYAYPEGTRPRISQVLVMPPFQRQGHGATLIQTFYNECYDRSDVLDITVEDPSENFQRVRDFVDARNCAHLASFQPGKLRKGFCEEMTNEAKEKLKLNKRQTRRIYEILRLKATNCSNPFEFRDYRLDVKKRLNMPFQKNGRDFEKLRRALKPNELVATLNNLSGEQRMEYLEKAYQECVDDYKRIIERIAGTTNGSC